MDILFKSSITSDWQKKLVLMLSARRKETLVMHWLKNEFDSKLGRKLWKTYSTETTAAAAHCPYSYIFIIDNLPCSPIPSGAQKMMQNNAGKQWIVATFSSSSCQLASWLGFRSTSKAQRGINGSGPQDVAAGQLVVYATTLNHGSDF